MCPLEDERTLETQQGSSRISTDDIAQTNGDTPQDSRSPLSQNVLDANCASSDPIATASASTASTDALLDALAESMGNLVARSGKNSGLLQDAQVSSFGWKRKIQNMEEVTVCMCGDLAAPTASDVVCCRITGCETKWVSLNHLFQEFRLIYIHTLVPSCLCRALVFAYGALDMRGLSEQCRWLETEASVRLV